MRTCILSAALAQRKAGWEAVGAFVHFTFSLFLSSRERSTLAQWLSAAQWWRRRTAANANASAQASTSSSAGQWPDPAVLSLGRPRGPAAAGNRATARGRMGRGSGPTHPSRSSERGAGHRPVGRDLKVAEGQPGGDPAEAGTVQRCSVRGRGSSQLLRFWVNPLSTLACNGRLF